MTATRAARRFRRGAVVGFGFAVGFVFILPVYWLVATSLAPSGSMGRFPPPLIPTSLSLDNYVDAFVTYDFGHFLLNSIVVCVAATALVIVLGSSAAYGLARTRIRGRLVILIALLVISTFPIVTVVTPLYAVFRSVGILNSYAALILPYTALNLPFAIWLLWNYFQGVPREIEEAGQVDGAGPLRVAAQLVIPQALPGVFVAATLTFVACWQEFLMALSFNGTRDFQTAPVGIALMSGYGSTPFGTIFAASVVALIPIVVLVFTMRRWIVGGGLSGAVKG